jgi:biopolymer transport protein ExbD
MGARLGGAAGRFGVRHNSEIKVTPFVDVMLVQLIIFMVAMPVATVSHNLDLPTVESSPSSAPPVVLSVQKDGSLYIGERPTSLAALSADLAKAAGDPATARVYLRAEGGAKYGQFMGVMNALHQRGYHQVSLVNEAL